MLRLTPIFLVAILGCQPLATTSPSLGEEADAGAPPSTPIAPHCGERALGDRWTAEDGCNTCTCLEEGVACTQTQECPERPCGDREVGEIWDHEDGCNQCACTERGIACTTEHCDGPPVEGVLQVCESDRECEDGSFCEPTYEVHGGRVGLRDELSICLPAVCEANDACPPGFLCDDRGRCRVTNGCDRDEHCSPDEICEPRDDGIAGCWMHRECRRQPCERHCEEDDQCPRGFQCHYGACFSEDPDSCERYGQGPGQMMCQPGNRQDAQEDARLCNPQRDQDQCEPGEACEPIRTSLDHDLQLDRGLCVGRRCNVLEDCPFQQYCDRGQCRQTVACRPYPHEVCEAAHCGLDQFCLESHRHGGGNERCITNQRCQQDDECEDEQRCNGLHCVAPGPCDHHRTEHYAGICVPSFVQDRDDYPNHPGDLEVNARPLQAGAGMEGELTAFDIDWFSFTPTSTGRYAFITERSNGDHLEAFCLMAYDVDGGRCESANEEDEWATCHVETRLGAGQQVFYGVRLYHPERNERTRYRIEVERR